MSTEKHPGWTLFVTASALVLLTVSFPTIVATHNSAGAGVQVAIAEEYDDAGELDPDVNPTIPPVYHEGEAEQGITEMPRFSPLDQRGHNYAAPECLEYQDDPDAYQDELDRLEDTVDASDPATREDTDICYVGLLDMRHQYVFVLSALAHPQPAHLYQVNPAPDDDYCRGQEDPNEATGVGPVDEVATRAERAADSEECNGDEHDLYTAGQNLLIDTALVETPVDSDEDTPGLADATAVEDTASGTLTLPNTLMRYVYLFGQPHPAVSLDEYAFTERPEAGQGVFGPNPQDGGDPVRDITGACGDRTQECKLLTPADIRAYDEDPPTNEEDTARVCTYQPSYFTVNPGELTSGACGAMTGTAIGGGFVDVVEDGGFGVDEAPNTYLEVLPGWNGFSHLLNHESTTLLADVGCDAGSICHDLLEDGDQARENGAGFFVAVNPEVPDLSGDTGHLWCVRPNILTTGPDQVFRDPLPDGLDWPEDREEILEQVSSVYDADAVDVDVFTHVLQSEAHGVSDAIHDDVRAIVGPVQDVAPDRADLVNPETLNDPLDVVSYSDAKAEVKQATPDEADEPIERADYWDASDTSASFPGHEAFTYEYETGLGCTDDGFLVDRPEGVTDQGGLNFAVGVSHGNTISLKDPTALDEQGLPAPNTDTHAGAWQAEEYSFGGSAVAHVDTVGSEAFDPCSQALGEPQPHRDFCVWRGVWDAYNEDCEEDERTCGDILRDRGYDVDDEGVGLFYTLTLSGVVVVDNTGDANPADPEGAQELVHVLGAEDPTAQHCIVGTSVGFDAYLPNHVDGANTLEAAIDALCSGTDGEVLFLEDAFNGGSSTGGGFSSDWLFTKLVPTPVAAQDEFGIGDDDSLCMNAVWSVQDGQVASDTERNLRLEGVNHYQHDLPLDSQADYDKTGIMSC